jgi:hypothetical protein
MRVKSFLEFMKNELSAFNRALNCDVPYEHSERGFLDMLARGERQLRIAQIVALEQASEKVALE